LVRPAGSCTVGATSLATLGPLLVKVATNVPVPPAATVAAPLLVMLATRSASGAVVKVYVAASGCAPGPVPPVEGCVVDVPTLLVMPALPGVADAVMGKLYELLLPASRALLGVVLGRVVVLGSVKDSTRVVVLYAIVTGELAYLACNAVSCAGLMLAPIGSVTDCVMPLAVAGPVLVKFTVKSPVGRPGFTVAGPVIVVVTSA
jgi:hypothetical protein